MGVPTGVLQAKNAGRLKPLVAGKRVGPAGPGTGLAGKHRIGGGVHKSATSAFGIDHGYIEKRKRSTKEGAKTGAQVGLITGAADVGAGIPRGVSRARELGLSRGKTAAALGLGAAAGMGVHAGIGAGIGAAIGRKQKKPGMPS